MPRAPSLPASPAIIATYLAAMADSGMKACTIGRRCAAIAYHHKIAGIVDPLPTASEGVTATLRGIRRTIGTCPPHDLCPDTLKGKRDRALLALGFAGAFRRSELLALRVEDLTETKDGLRVLIRRSKTDQEGEGQEIAIPRGSRLRPVASAPCRHAVTGSPTRDRRAPRRGTPRRCRGGCDRHTSPDRDRRGVERCLHRLA